MKKKLPDQKIFPLRITGNMHKQLRKLAYITGLPMAELIRQAIESKLKDCKKILTNIDIAI